LSVGFMVGDGSLRPAPICTPLLLASLVADELGRAAHKAALRLLILAQQELSAADAGSRDLPPASRAISFRSLLKQKDRLAAVSPKSDLVPRFSNIWTQIPLSHRTETLTHADRNHPVCHCSTYPQH